MPWGKVWGAVPAVQFLESVLTAGAFPGEAHSLCAASEVAAFEVCSIFIAARHLHAVFAFGAARPVVEPLLGAWKSSPHVQNSEVGFAKGMGGQCQKMHVALFMDSCDILHGCMWQDSWHSWGELAPYPQPDIPKQGGAPWFAKPAALLLLALRPCCSSSACFALRRNECSHT